jgi:hypothetical protein
MELLALSATFPIEAVHARENTLARGVINAFVVVLTIQFVHVCSRVIFIYFLTVLVCDAAW